MKMLRVLGIGVGAALLAGLVWDVGWEPIHKTLAQLRAGYLIVLAYPVTWMVFNTAGWRWALHAQFARVRLLDLAQIRLAGETFNWLLPSAYVGGEPVKAKLLSAWMPLSEAASSVLVAKAAQSVGLVLFVGFGLSLGRLDRAAPWGRSATAFSVAALALGIGLFVVLLGRRSFSRLGRALHSVTRHPWLQRQEARLVALDDSLGAFYREGRLRFLASILWHSAGWLAGALEVAVLFSLLGHPVGWRAAWFVGAMAQLGAVLGLFAPAGIGLYEGGHYMAALLLGLPPSLGLSVSLIRRVREIFWAGVGLVIFWYRSRARSK